MAENILNCYTAGIPSIEEAILGIQALKAEREVYQTNKYKSYWQQFRIDSETERDRLQGLYDSAVTDMVKTNTNIFTTSSQGVGETIATTTSRRILRRELEGERSDLIMIDELSSTQHPSGIRVCQDDDQVAYLASQQALLLDPASAGLASPLNSPVVGGFQMMYGTGSSRVVGPAHGDVSIGSCLEKNFPGSPSAVNIYTDKTDPAVTETLMGIRLLFDIAGQATPAAISLGAVEEINMTKY